MEDGRNPKPQTRNEMEGDATEKHVFYQVNFNEPQGKFKNGDCNTYL